MDSSNMEKAVMYVERLSHCNTVTYIHAVLLAAKL
jgi:hypothetical protein